MHPLTILTWMSITQISLTINFAVMTADSQHAPATLMHPSLQQPLSTFMLLHLPPQVLLALRQTCQTTQRLVDHDTSDLWSTIAMGLGVPRQQLLMDPWNAHAMHAALHRKAATISRVRRWDASWTQPHKDLLKGFESPCIKAKLNWVWHVDASEDEATIPSCQYLVVQDGSAVGCPSYASDTESGRWEVTFSARSALQPQVAVVEVPSGEAAIIHQSAATHEQLQSNCCHAFQILGEAHLPCGACGSFQGLLTNRLRMYKLDIMALYGAHEEDSADYFAVLRQEQEENCPLDYLLPEPDWQQELTWQAEAADASVAGHGSQVAVQTGRCSFVVMDLTLRIKLVDRNCDEDASADSDIIGLQWSSSGDLLAVQCANACHAQLILMETCRWQRIACCKYGTDFSIVWAPTKPSLAIIDGNTAQVRPKQLLQSLECPDPCMQMTQCLSLVSELPLQLAWRTSPEKFSLIACFACQPLL